MFYEYLALAILIFNLSWNDLQIIFFFFFFYLPVI